MDLDPQVVADANLLWYFERGQVPEPEVVHAMLRMVRPGDFVVDAGANIGFFTLLMARLVGPRGKVLAIEPGSNNLPHLHTNIALNDVSNVQVEDAVLWSDVATIDWHETVDGGENHASTYVAEDTERTTTTLDALLVGQPYPRLLKLDIEGAEFEALKGLSDFDRPPYMIVECNTEALQRHGHTLGNIRQLIIGGSQFSPRDLFILHPDGSLPTCVSCSTVLHTTRPNTNLLFSTRADVGRAWPEVTVP